MKRSSGKLRLGIIGCGAIGSRIALSTRKELKSQFMVSAVFDIDPVKSHKLSRRLGSPRVVRSSLEEVLKRADLIVEAVNSPATAEIVRRALLARKNVVSMSIGRLLDQGGLFTLAEKVGRTLLIPSGAIAGLDAVKAARIVGIRSIVLTTRKPPQGFADNPFLVNKGIRLDKLKRETVLFDGDVADAVKYFPQNINVAAALTLAAGPEARVRVKIIASPKIKRNTHEIALDGDFGSIRTVAENTICPDNPKTSYLAVLSAIQTLKQFASQVKIGT